MKFILNSKTLLEKLQLMSGVILSKNTLPVLDNFLFKIEGKKIIITASDLETTMSTEIELEKEVESSALIAIQGKMLVETLKSMSHQPLVFTIEDNNVVEISSESGKYALAYVDGNEFPKKVTLAKPATTVIPSRVLLNAISKTIFAAGNDDLRPIMSGVLFQLSSKGLTFVATDAHKLVKYSRTDVIADQESEFILPKKPLNLLKSILTGTDEEIKVEYNDSNASFTTEKFILTCRLIEGKYPNYEAVIPKENPNKATINRNKLLNSVKCVALFANKTTHQIRLAFGGPVLNISAEDIDYSNKADEQIECDYLGEDMKIGFNSRFLIEMLSNIQSEEIKLEMSFPNKAGVLTPDDSLDEGENVLMLVMPVMLTN